MHGVLVVLISNIVHMFVGGIWYGAVVAKQWPSILGY
jgi:hypothetical protein